MLEAAYYMRIPQPSSSMPNTGGGENKHGQERDLQVTNLRCPQNAIGGATSSPWVARALCLNRSDT